VPAQYIVSIIGVETFYGRHTGRYRVVEALTTLAFDYPPRADFFRSELEQYLLLARDAGVDVFEVRGSYAGAIGIPQFMPGSLRRYAVDFDGSGVIDLRSSRTDAIGSVANFLRQHGWQPGERPSYKARLARPEAAALADGSLKPGRTLAELVAAGVELDVAPADAHAPAALIALGSEYRVGLQNFYVITRYNRSSLYASAVCDLADALRRRHSAGK
jgi:membrane-bound lytic murein transglycosylase B